MEVSRPAVLGVLAAGALLPLACGWIAPLDAHANLDAGAAPPASDTGVLETPDARGDVGVAVEDGGRDGAALPPYASLVLGDGPLAYWRMSPAAGDTIVDETGNGRTLHLQGSYTSMPGAIQNDPDLAVSFDGATAYAFLNQVSSAAFDFDDRHPFTLESWAVHTAPSPDDPGFGHIMGHSEGGGSGRLGFIVYCSTASGKLQFEYDGDAGQFSTITALDTPSKDFVHVVAIFDGTAIQFYANGAPDGSPRRPGGSLPNRIARFVIGHDEATAKSFWHGGIDEVAIYDRALGAEEIARHYKAGRP